MSALKSEIIVIAFLVLNPSITKDMLFSTINNMKIVLSTFCIVKKSKNDKNINDLSINYAYDVLISLYLFIIFTITDIPRNVLLAEITNSVTIPMSMLEKIVLIKSDSKFKLKD